jgi:hypothetical protein
MGLQKQILVKEMNMRTVVEWIGSLFGKKTVRVIKVEGKETKEAKGRTHRLKEAREAKEARLLVGNKKSTNTFED